VAESIGLDRLSCFLVVAETGSFSTAAARLGIPKSSLSRRIDRLEREVGVRLLNRTTRRVSLSTAGTTLFERAAPALRSLTDVLSSLPERDEAPSGTLRVTAPNDFGAEVLAGLLPTFSKRYPGVHLDLRLTNRTVDLVAEGFDLAIRVVTGPLADSGMVVRRLMPATIEVFAAPAYLKARGTPKTWADAAHHDWVAFRNPRHRRSDEASGRVVASADDFQFVRRALCAGVGLGRLPSFLAKDDVAEDRLVRVLPEASWQDGRFVLMYPKMPNVPRKLVALRDFLLETLSV